MYQKMTTLVARLAEGSNGNLGLIFVEFPDDGFRWTGAWEAEGDEHWRKGASDYWNDGMNANGKEPYFEDPDDTVVLNRIIGWKVPIVEYLLLPLFELPVCECAVLTPLEGIHCTNNRWDYFCMSELFDSLERWIEGERTVPWADRRKVNPYPEADKLTASHALPY